MRYWRLTRAPGVPIARPLDELHAELVAHLEEAVRVRLVSDVPLGAFLSGGIDSSAVVAMMARAGGGRVKTFSIGFAAKEYDETRYARMVAQRYGTDHEEQVVEPDAVAVVPRLVWHYGEPFADPSAVPTWYVAELARRRSHGGADRRWRRRMLSRLWPIPGDALSRPPRPAATLGPRAAGPAARRSPPAAAAAIKAAPDPRRASGAAELAGPALRPNDRVLCRPRQTRGLWRGDAHAPRSLRRRSVRSLFRRGGKPGRRRQPAPIFTPIFPTI